MQTQDDIKAVVAQGVKIWRGTVGEGDILVVPYGFMWNEMTSGDMNIGLKVGCLFASDADQIRSLGGKFGLVSEAMVGQAWEAHLIRINLQSCLCTGHCRVCACAR